MTLLLSSSWLNTFVRFGINILKLNAAVGVVLGGLLYFFQGKLIYPSGMPPGSREKVPIPSDFEIKDWEEIELVSPDQVRIQAFTILATPPPISMIINSLRNNKFDKDVSRGRDLNSDQDLINEWRSRRPTILMLHANAGNVGHRLPLSKVFVEKFRFNVLAISYRGYGHSTGSPSEVGILSDSQTALDYLRSHPILRNSLIFLYGQSLGGAVAIGLVSDRKNRGKISGVVLENTFSNLRKLIPFVMPVLKPFRFLCHQTWKSDERIESLDPKDSPPFLFLSGSKDDLVPASHFRELFELCKTDKKKWVDFQNGHHNDTCLQEGYFPIIAEWIEEILNRTEPKK
ncbi:Alpha/Beta hydrolase protein [Phakopsora pachyrhizi]|uniref:Alpha/Beta hydrolase protein n=1 Tax=Phakopsora pachyrhizi TaxID=170000 RepID=A0AAV0B2B7_PHAPC|nr:Alpha/Beta hydrolase protein [Phakopsora pachyrhizi]CAH7676435.1 Alpha/Beta hydrolase protein [Phakopsora pachyrhizi]